MTSIIILNLKREDLLIQCLESIVESTDKPYRIIVVDNEHDRERFKSVLQSTPYLNPKNEIHTIINRSNPGFAYGNNQGIELAKKLGTDYYMLLNNDTLVTEGWLSEMKRVAEAWDEIGLVAPVSNPADWNADPRMRTALERYKERFYQYFKASLKAYAEQFKSNREGFSTVDFAAYFCVLIPSHVMDKVGPLNDIFGIGTWEDNDHIARMKRHGYKLVRAHRAYVHHIRNQTVKNFDMEKIHKMNRAIYDELHPGRDYLGMESGPASYENTSPMERVYYATKAKAKILAYKAKGGVIHT